MRIAVIGGAGFLGTHLVRALLRDNHTVLAYDSLFAGRGVEDLDWQGAAELVIGDILDGERLGHTLCRFQPDVVFHLAAIHYIPICDHQPAQAMRVNVEGTLNVMLAAAAARARGVGFASSVAVYPPTSDVHREDGPAVPYDVYGLSKLLGERVVEQYARQHAMAHLSFRFSNIYGPLETNPHVIPAITAQLLEGSRTLRLGRTDTFRDYIFAPDLADALALAVTLLAAGTCHDVFNVGSGSEASVQELIDILCELTGESVELTRDEARMRPADRKHLRADVSRIQQALGWRAAHDLRSGLAHTWDFERTRLQRRTAAGVCA